MSKSKENLGPALRVVVKPGSKAEIVARLRHRRRMLAARAPTAAFPQHPELDLKDHGGRIVANLSFWNIFVGGEQA